MEPIGAYTLLNEVARGGAGVVYRAVAPDGRHVALKLLLAGKDASPLQRRRATTEIRALQRLRHEHVVPLLDAGEHQGAPYAVLEWIEGESLQARLRRDGPLKPVWAVELVRRLCLAVEHGHARGVLHRDIKPDNVMIRTADGEPLLTDFGLGKDLDQTISASSPGTVADRWLGTPGWWPPEQARGQLGAIGPRSDVYGLGALLYSALTARAPQEGETILEQVRALELPPVPPSRHQPGLPPWLDAVCLRALDPEPERRPDSAAELAALLERGAKGQLSLQEARGGGAPQPRRRLLVAIAALVVLIGVSLTALWVLPANHARDADVHAMRGAALAKQGRWAEAVVELERAIELDARNEMAHYDRGIALTELGRSGEALASLDQAVALAPEQAKPRSARAVALVRLGRLDEALADAERATSLDPSDATAHGDRGAVLAHLGRWSEAEAALGSAIALDPWKPLAFHGRGVARAQQQRWDEALADFDRTIQLDPGHGMAHAERGLVHSKLGRGDEAMADLDRAIALEPDLVQAWINRAQEHARRGAWEAMIADCDRVIALDARSAEAWVNRAAARGRLGRYEGALADFDRALELAPDASWAADIRDERAKLAAMLAR